MNFSASELNQIRGLLALRFAQRAQALESKERGPVTLLESREKLLLGLLDGKGGGYVGSLEHAASRCILRSAFGELKKQGLTDAEGRSMEALEEIFKLDDVKIGAQAWRQLEQRGDIVGPDGQIFSTNKYDGLDPQWAFSLLYYEHYKNNKATFVRQINTSGVAVSSDRVRVAVVGDLGTGPYTNADGVQPSSLVIDKIQSYSPDYTIHLGDVYYNGTIASDPWLPSEEQKNLVDVWSLPDGKSFTLNSNHEMYDGGNGYFSVALASKKFSLQNGASYFALVHDDWVILGLDSAYYDSSYLYMDGALVDDGQLEFIKGIDTAGKRVIVMTHHTGLNDTGSTRNALWSNVSEALSGRDPDYWYWGHTHNGIVYSDQADVGSTKARCVGHGAIPFTKAPELYKEDGTTIPEVLYYAGQELPPQPDNGRIQLAKNGFAILTITPSSLDEAFYDLNGQQVWP